MSYILTDPKKREHIAADSIEVDHLIEEMRKEFGASFKFKIRVNRDTQATPARESAGAA